jgi:hypothetical protein
MALTGPDFWSPERGGVMPTGIGQRCFYREKPVTHEPAVTSNGATGQIWLHPGCAADHSARLLTDVVRWQRQSGRRFHDLERRK